MGDSNLGIAGGLVPNSYSNGNGLVSDSTQIPAQIRAIMAKKRAENTTPLYTQKDALEAIKNGYKGMTQEQRDSVANKFDHQAYLAHLDQLGMQVVPKPKP